MIGGGGRLAQEYECEVVTEGAVPDVEFSAGEQQLGVHVDVRVQPWDGLGWVGRFRAPVPGVRALDALLATPSPEALCVIVKGTAFLGRVDDQVSFGLVTTGPVVAAEALPAEAVLLLTTPWTVTAVDDLGVRWTSKRLAVDGLRLDEVTDGAVRGVADPADEEPRNFAIDLATGTVAGGASLW